MTEKRFWILNTLTEYSGIKDKDKLLTFNEVVDLLNEQHEQIERLKQNFRALDEVKCELEEENEQLKAILKQFTGSKYNDKMGIN